MSENWEQTARLALARHTLRAIVKNGWVHPMALEGVLRSARTAGRGTSPMAGGIVNVEAHFSNGKPGTQMNSVHPFDIDPELCRVARAVRFDGRISAGYRNGVLLGTSIFEHFGSASVCSGQL